MAHKSIQDRVTDIIIEDLCLGEPPLLTDKITGDLGGDSLDIVEIVMMMEAEFGVDLEAGDFSDETTVGDLIEHLKKLGVA